MIYLPLAAVLVIGSSHQTMRDLLGVRPGESFEAACEKLELVSTPSKEKGDEDDDQASFTLKGTAYKSVVLRASHKKVVWISAFARDSGGIPFSTFGDLTAAKSTDSLATWEIRDTAQPYRVLVQGSKRHAQVVTLIAPALLARKF